MPSATGSNAAPRATRRYAGWLPPSSLCCRFFSFCESWASYSARLKIKYSSIISFTKLRELQPQREPDVMREQTVVIKGIKDGLLISLNPTEEWNIVTADLAARIDEQMAFFSGARVTVDVGERPVRKDELSSLKALLERRGITLQAVSSESHTTIEAAIALDLRTSNISTNHARDGVDPEAEGVAFIVNHQEEDGSYGIMIRRTVRSGRRVHSLGHVVVFGDVNPGAEIIAGGDVIVWGRLRGNVHAGANGDENAVVCALDMIPTQLRIAGHISVSPDEKRRKPRPETAFIRDNQIVVEAWK
nr:MAG: septum site-determining protein MinC [Chloroflexota bacterium]